MVAKNHTLQSLSLDHNPLGRWGLWRILQAAVHNSSLQSLGLFDVSTSVYPCEACVQAFCIQSYSSIRAQAMCHSIACSAIMLIGVHALFRSSSM
jgi:hypothetical protein